MKTYTLKDIRKLNPCYDPSKYALKDWEGTILDILNADIVPAYDRIWLACELLDDKTNRLFAVYCAKEALKLINKPDKRSIKACNVAEKYANGKASIQELRAAYSAANTAVYAARASNAAAYAARAAYAASNAATNSAAYAAYAASNAATNSAANTAVARQNQIAKLIEMVQELEN